jgi:regulator of protease activity HflC (stomatin/prohibitin superfamily)
MTAENIVTLLVLAFVVYQIQKRIKILGEGEAFVVIILGRYKELNNSAGLHFKTSVVVK